MWPTVDTVLNDEFFGRPGVSKGENSALPQARLVALPECGPTRSSTRRSARARHQNLVCLSKLVDRLEPCMVLLADRGITGFALWQQATATGAELVVAGEEQRDTSPDRGARGWVMAR